MKNKNLNVEELEQVAGGNQNETRELGQYLYKKFPECFSDPADIRDIEIFRCLSEKVPEFRGLSEPGDARTNTYNFKGMWEGIPHSEFMAKLHNLFGE